MTLDPQQLEDLVDRALAEDVRGGDVTTEATVDADRMAVATITQKQPGAVFGFEVAEIVFRRLDPAVQVEPLAVEGRWNEPGTPVYRASGTARGLLTAERTALNLMQRLSGVCTMAATAARLVAEAGGGAKVLDTRKTTPGMRALEKAAVAAGGATNHRFGLWDAVLIKENHIALAGGITAAVQRGQAAAHSLGTWIECEVRSREEVDEALAAGATRLLLDNFTPQQLPAIVEHVGGRAVLEASGGVTLETLVSYAKTGVDFVSVGALTHSAPALDLSLALEAAP